MALTKFLVCRRVNTPLLLGTKNSGNKRSTYSWPAANKGIWTLLSRPPLINGDAEQIVGPERRKRVVIADFQLPIVDLIRAARSTQTFGAMLMIRFVSLICLMVAVVAPSIGRASADKISSEEYSVYSSLINSRFVSRKTKLVVLEGRTQFDDHMVTIPKEFENDLRPKTSTNYTLQRRLHIRAKYLLLTQAQLDAIFERDLREAWKIFWKRYDTGLLAFSRVGFNDTKTKAFVYVADVCGALCGYGRTFVLEKQNGAWKIVEEKQVWIS
jgi:hypothetical protein